MFAASVDGELYDPAKWGNFYKPYGVEVPATAVQASSAPAQVSAPVPTPVTVPVTAPAPAVVETTAPVVETAAPVVETAAPVVETAAPVVENEDKGKKSADDILALIRNRSQS